MRIKEFLFSESDNGVGLPDNLDIHNSSGPGMKFIQSIALQMGGSFKICRRAETEFAVHFPLDKE